MRAGLGIGWREGEFFNEANFRLAFHDLLDPEYGYTPVAQIQALGLTLRHYRRSESYQDRKIYPARHPVSFPCRCSLCESIVEDQRSARHHTASQM